MRRGDRFLFLVLTAVLMTVMAFAAFWEHSALPPVFTPIPTGTPASISTVHTASRMERRGHLTYNGIRRLILRDT